jgi:ABC-type lipoprotein release transport system permease subunit
VLLTGVQRRRRDLAVLKTLGLLRSQLLRVVCWQASALAAVALLAGLPLGLLAGRWAWRLFAGSAGVGGDADIPVLLVAAVIPVTLVLANAIAAVPGWTAARIPPGADLAQRVAGDIGIGAGSPLRAGLRRRLTASRHQGMANVSSKRAPPFS